MDHLNLFVLAQTLHETKMSKKVVIETIQFKLNARLDELVVVFACDKQQISSCAIKGIASEVIVKKSYTQITARLALLTVLDLNPKTIYSKVLDFISP